MSNAITVSDKALTLALLDGEPNIKRAMALLADKDLKDQVSLRNALLIEYGVKKEGASSKGLMLQINTRTKKALGISVANEHDDPLVQSLAGQIRSVCSVIIEQHCQRVSKLANEAKSEAVSTQYLIEEIERMDGELKRKVYQTIERLASSYKDLIEVKPV